MVSSVLLYHFFVKIPMIRKHSTLTVQKGKRHMGTMVKAVLCEREKQLN